MVPFNVDNKIGVEIHVIQSTGYEFDIHLMSTSIASDSKMINTRIFQSVSLFMYPPCAAFITTHRADILQIIETSIFGCPHIFRIYCSRSSFWDFRDHPPWLKSKAILEISDSSLHNIQPRLFSPCHPPCESDEHITILE